MISAPGLAELVDLLLQPKLDSGGQVQALAIPSLDVLAGTISAKCARCVTAGQIDDWSHAGLLPDWALRPMLSLFGRLDGLSLTKTEDAPIGAHQDMESLDANSSRIRVSPTLPSSYRSLLVEQVDALCARVRLAGGAAGVRRPGAVWDEFVSRQPSAAQPREDRVAVALVQGDSREQVSACGSVRAIQEVAAHSRVALEIQVPEALLATDEAVHLFLFQDVRTEDARQFVAMLPLPATPGFRVAPMPTRSSLVMHPIEPDEANCFIVPEHWGPVRRMFGVASTRPFGRALIEDAMMNWTISPSMLDLLAARLQDPDRWKAGSFEVWQATYSVETEAAARPLGRRTLPRSH